MLFMVIIYFNFSATLHQDSRTSTSFQVIGEYEKASV